MDDGSGDYKDDETACVIRYENEGWHGYKDSERPQQNSRHAIIPLRSVFNTN